MTVQKPNPTALTSILALLLATGTLAGCDYASKLPDAPETLGYELQQRKPPSVTGVDSPGSSAVAGAPRPAPTVVDTQEVHSVPLPPTSTVAQRAVPQGSPIVGLPEYRSNAEAQSLPLPPPVEVADAPLEQMFADSARPRGGTVGTPDDSFGTPRFDPPQIGVVSGYADTLPAPVPFDAQGSTQTYQGGSYQVEVTQVPAQPLAFDQTPTFGGQSYESVGSVDSFVSGGTVSGGVISYADPAPVTGGESFAPGISYDVAAAPVSTVPQRTAPEYTVPPLATPLPFESPPPLYRGIGADGGTVSNSPVAVIRARLSNGAIVNVHPVIGVPSGASRELARTIATEIGSPVRDAGAVASAPAVFDLRAGAPAGTTAEWKLHDSRRQVIGTFSESQPAGGWASATDEEIRSIGRRVADRLRRNAELRRATLNAVANAPIETAPQFVQSESRAASQGRKPGAVPLPLRNPRRTASIVAQAAPSVSAIRPRPEPVTTAPLAPLTPVAPVAAAPQPRIVTTVPRLRPTPPVRVAPTPELLAVRPTPAPAPAPAPVAQPVETAMIAPQPVAPVTATPAAPPPSFETLRAKPQPVDGPRSVVFQGVRGAPGDGDQALSREMGRVLAQSPAKLAPGGTPGAVYLTAEVSTERSGSADRIKITWQVQDEAGNKVGQVVQENDVPLGALDGGWGEDAYFATQGAKQGIMELLQEAGALG